MKNLVYIVESDVIMMTPDGLMEYRIQHVSFTKKQKFPLRYFYGESANAIKIQIWVTLIANLLLMIIQKRIKRTWSFSGLATMVRIMLMYYINCYTFFEEPEKDWAKMVAKNAEIVS